MNVVKEINRINEKELELGLNGASWHDEYKDSAYVFVGGLHVDLTEGDVITILSQYGEVMDANMPRDKETGKPKGFAFVMYEDQRSTVLAVDNLNGAQVLGRTLRVDHVKNYKQPKSKNEDGEWVEPEEQSLNAKPQMIEEAGTESDSSASTGASIDPEDPMRDYLIAQRREAKALKTKKSKGKGKHKDETPEERRARKAKKKEKRKKRVKTAGMKGVEDLLSSLGRQRDFDPEEMVQRNRPRERSLDRNQRSNSPRRHERPHSPNRLSTWNKDDDRPRKRSREPDEEDLSRRRDSYSKASREYRR